MLPKAVREAGEKADALHSGLSGNTDQLAAPDKPVEKVMPEVQPEPVKAEPVAQQPPADGWEHKYKVLSNKYSAEVPRLAQELREMKDKIREQSEKMASAPVAELPSGLTPEKVVETFGEDFAAAVGALASKISEQHSTKLREEFAPRVEAATSSANANARQVFLRQLSDSVPDWQVIDQEDAFTAFLDEYDQLTGRQRRQFFIEADQSNDAHRIISFFTAYREGSSVKKTLREEVAKNAMEYSLSPSGVRTSDAPAGKKVWSPGEIRKFYTDARRGIYSTGEYERIESDIFAAQNEGRLLAA